MTKAEATLKAETLLREWATNHSYNGDVPTLLKVYEGQSGSDGSYVFTLEEFVWSEVVRADAKLDLQSGDTPSEARAKLTRIDKMLEALEELEELQPRQKVA